MYWFKLMRNSAATSGAGNFYVIFKREKVKPELGDVWLGRWAKLEQYFHGLWQHWMRRSTTNEPTRHQHQYLSPRSDLNATQQFTDKLSLETIICACTPQYRSPGGHCRHWGPLLSCVREPELPTTCSIGLMGIYSVLRSWYFPGFLLRSHHLACLFLCVLSILSFYPVSTPHRLVCHYHVFISFLRRPLVLVQCSVSSIVRR